MNTFVPMVKPRGRNVSVMAASVSVPADWRPPVYEKADDEMLMLAQRVGQNALMKHLGKKEVGRGRGRGRVVVAVAVGCGGGDGGRYGGW